VIRESKLGAGWLLLAVACGCSARHTEASPTAVPAEPLEPLFVSGSRLRARVADAGGGARRLLDWYDTLLETTCTFRPMTDGQYRCVPAGETPRLGLFTTFADDACTVPVGRDGSCPATLGQYVAIREPPRPEPWSPFPQTPLPCHTSSEDQLPGETPVAAYRLGTALPEGQAVFELSQGECRAGETAGPLYELEPIAPESLVAATRRVEPRGDSLLLEILDGQDGSRASGLVYDRKRMRPCIGNWRGLVPEEGYRCFSVNESRVADESCERFGILASCDDEVALQLENGSPWTSGLYRLGTRIDTPRVREPAGAAACQDEAWPLPEGFALYERGEPFPFQEFPALATRLLGTARIQVPFARAADDVRPLFVNLEGSDSDRFTPGPFWDSERGERCDWQVGPDRVTRCFPQRALTTRDYADADCNIPLMDAVLGAPGALVRTILPLAELCASEHALGALVTTTEPRVRDFHFSRQPDGTCVRFESPNRSYFDTAPVNLDVFEEIAISTE
jgi:hypothetical protein